MLAGARTGSPAAAVGPRGSVWRVLSLAGGTLAVSLAIGALAVNAPQSLAPEQLLSLRALAAVVVLLIGCVALLRSPTIAIVALGLTVYLNLSQVLVRYHGFPSLLQLLALPLLVVAWIRRGDSARLRALTHPLGAALVVYGLFLLASTAWARDVVLSDARVVENLRLLVIYGITAMLAATRPQLRAAVWSIVAAGAILSLLAIVQKVTGDYSHDFGGLARVKQAQVYGDVFEPRVAGSLGDPNFFGQLLVPLLPLALFLGWEERQRRVQVLAFVLAAIIAVGVVLTYSRGAALALGVAVVFTLASHRTRLRKAVVIAGVAAIAVVVWVPTDFTRRLATVAQIVSRDEAPLHLDSSFEERRLLARTAWAIFSDHPVIGVGAGNYTTFFDAYADDVGSAARTYDDPGEPRYPHNLYLEIGAETGITGVVIFAVAVIVCLVSLQGAHATAARDGDTYVAGIARGLQIGVIGHMVAGLFLHGAFQRHVWLLLGLAAAVSAIAASPKGARAEA